MRERVQIPVRKKSTIKGSNRIGGTLSAQLADGFRQNPPLTDFSGTVVFDPAPKFIFQQRLHAVSEPLVNADSTVWTFLYTLRYKR